MCSRYGWSEFLWRSNDFNPFNPESDQCQISPAASPEILRHTVWRTWLFIAYSGERWLYYKFLLPHLYIFSLRGWENVLFELRSERVKKPALIHNVTVWSCFICPFRAWHCNQYSSSCNQNISFCEHHLQAVNATAFFPNFELCPYCACFVFCFWNELHYAEW